MTEMSLVLLRRPSAKVRWRRLRRVGVAALALAAYKAWLYLAGVAMVLLSLAGVSHQVVLTIFIAAVLIVPLAFAGVVAIRLVAGGAVWAALARTRRVSLWLTPDNVSTVGLLAIGTILPPVVEFGRRRPGGTAASIVLAIVEAWAAIAILASTKEIDEGIDRYRRDIDHLTRNSSFRRDPLRTLVARCAAWVLSTGALSTSGLLHQLVATIAFFDIDPVSPWQFTPFVPLAVALTIAGLETLSLRLQPGQD